MGVGVKRKVAAETRKDLLEMQEDELELESTLEQNDARQTRIVELQDRITQPFAS